MRSAECRPRTIIHFASKETSPTDGSSINSRTPAPYCHDESHILLGVFLLFSLNRSVHLAMNIRVLHRRVKKIEAEIQVHGLESLSGY